MCNRTFARIVILSFLAVVSASATAIEAQTVFLRPPDDAAVPGATSTVVAYYINDGAEPVKVDAPQTLTATAAWAGGTADVLLTRAADDAHEADVQPGAFARVPYTFTVPASASGPITLALPGGGATAVVKVGTADVATQQPATAPVPAAVAAPVPASRTGSEREFTAPYLGPSPVRAQTTPEGFVEYFASHFSAYEPVYFLVGPDRPNAKFQVSFKYQVFNENAPVVNAVPALGGLYVAYSQTSFWDLEGDSKPFFDSSYRPEVMLSYADVLPGDAEQDDVGVLRQLGLQVSLAHESNGRSGDDSRSLNSFYVRPTFTFGDAERDPRGLFFSVAPRFQVYIEKDDNPDIDEYRGYGDLKLTLGYREGLQLAAIGRVGSDWDKGSVQLDLSYPLRPLLKNNVDAFLHFQMFTGYGESLLEYDERDTSYRLGVSLIR